MIHHILKKVPGKGVQNQILSDGQKLLIYLSFAPLKGSKLRDGIG